jgi:hypothetical protein
MYSPFLPPYPILLISIAAILFTLGLAITAPQDWTVDQKLPVASCYLLIVGRLTAVQCYL